MLRSMIRLLKVPLAESQFIRLMPIRPKIVTISANNLHLTSKWRKHDDRKDIKATLSKEDEGTEGEKLIDIDTVATRDDMFPDENSHNRLFNGIPFKELPIINIRVSHNNTILSLTDYKGVLKLINSCGVEGFKNAKKGTNVAAQATAISLCSKALEQGYKTVRIRVRGIGPGRMSAIKGVEMSGMNIVSVTDNTRVTWTPLRARKARRL